MSARMAGSGWLATTPSSTAARAERSCSARRLAVMSVHAPATSSASAARLGTTRNSSRTQIMRPSRQRKRYSWLNWPSAIRRAECASTSSRIAGSRFAAHQPGVMVSAAV